MFVRLIIVLCLGMVIPGPVAFAATKAASEHKAKLATKKVRQGDGQVVERIVLPASAAPAMPADKPVTPELWAERSLDPAWMAMLAKDPKVFAQWMDAVSEPRFMTALATVVAQPGTYPKAMGKFLNPAMLNNWSEVATPGVVLTWMAAGMDPRYYLTVFNRLTDARKIQRWANCASPADEAVKPTGTTTGTGWVTLSDPPKPLPWLQGQTPARY